MPSRAKLDKFKTKWEVGDPIPVSWLEIVSRFVSNFQVSGTASYGFNGHVPDLRVRGGGGGGCSNFSITTEAESTGGGNFKIVCSVSAGVFQGVPDGTYDGIPTFDGSGKINADPAPTKDLTENGTWYIHFKMTFNGSEQLTAVDIHFTDPGTALPTDTAGTTHYYLLGTVEVSGDGTSSAAAVITQGTCENKTVKLCGGTVATIGNG